MHAKFYRWLRPAGKRMDGMSKRRFVNVAVLLRGDIAERRLIWFRNLPPIFSRGSANNRHNRDRPHKIPLSLAPGKQKNI